MPRMRPAILRRSQLPGPCWHTVPHVPGLDRRGQYQISRIELWTAHDWAREGFWPGVTTEALSAWRHMSRHPRTRISLPCGCCGRHARTLLQQVVDALPGPAAHMLAALLTQPDDDFRRRTVPDPHLPGTLPWWERRFPR